MYRIDGILLSKMAGLSTHAGSSFLHPSILQHSTCIHTNDNLYSNIITIIILSPPSMSLRLLRVTRDGRGWAESSLSERAHNDLVNLITVTYHDVRIGRISTRASAASSSAAHSFSSVIGSSKSVVQCGPITLPLRLLDQTVMTAPSLHYNRLVALSWS